MAAQALYSGLARTPLEVDGKPADVAVSGLDIEGQMFGEFRVAVANQAEGGFNRFGGR